MQNDGALEVHEVYGLDLSKADLVVLSACLTQLGNLSLGDEVVGLTRAFIYAGSPTVIASLWTVDDEATGLLMVSFYRHLKDGKGKAEALRAVQAETRAKYPNPYYWSAFVLTGDPGPAAQRDTPRSIWIGAGVASVLVAGGSAVWVRRERRGAAWGKAE